MKDAYQSTLNRRKVKLQSISLPNLIAFSFARGLFFNAVQIICVTPAGHCGFFGCILHVAVSSPWTP